MCAPRLNAYSTIFVSMQNHGLRASDTILHPSHGRSSEAGAHTRLDERLIARGGNRSVSRHNDLPGCVNFGYLIEGARIERVCQIRRFREERRRLVGSDRKLCCRYCFALGHHQWRTTRCTLQRSAPFGAKPFRASGSARCSSSCRPTRQKKDAPSYCKVLETSRGV